MVLHHVTQCTSGFVKRAPLFHAQLFGNGDLDVGDVLASPQRLKQGIAKPQGEQVLHGGFAQVMVNAVNLLFGKNLAHGVVDSAVAGQVMAQRLFQHHPGVGGVESGGGQLLTNGGEQTGGSGQVHDHGVNPVSYTHLDVYKRQVPPC